MVVFGNNFDNNNSCNGKEFPYQQIMGKENKFLLTFVNLRDIVLNVRISGGVCHGTHIMVFHLFRYAVR